MTGRWYGKLVAVLLLTLNLFGCGGGSGGTGNSGGSGNGGSGGGPQNPPPLTPAYLAYAIDNASRAVLEYQGAAGGALTPLTAPAVNGPNLTSQIALVPGKRLLLAQGEGFTAFQISSDGHLVRAALSGTASTLTGRLLFTPDGHYAFQWTGLDANIHRFQVDGDLTLTPLKPDAPPPGRYMANRTALALTPDGRFLYAADESQHLAEYRVGTDGSLTLLRPAIEQPGFGASAVVHREMKVTDNGRYLFALSSLGITRFGVGTDGRLTPLRPAVMNVMPKASPENQLLSLTVSSDSRFAYITTTAFTVLSFVVGADGSLKQGRTLGFPRTIHLLSFALGPDNRFAYVGTQFSISQFRVGADGNLTLLSPATVAARFPTALTVIAPATP